MYVVGAAYSGHGWTPSILLGSMLGPSTHSVWYDDMSCRRCVGSVVVEDGRSVRSLVSQS